MINKVSLWYLAKTFLIVGSTSFGGYAALIAVVQQILVERDKVLDDQTIIKGFSIASILPGPVAVNTVAFVGYRLAGWIGALISVTMVLLPSVVLIIGITALHNAYQNNTIFSGFLSGVIPVVAAIIFLTALKLGKQNIRSLGHSLVLLLVLTIQVFFSGFWSYLVCFLIGGGWGYFFAHVENNTKIEFQQRKFGVTHLIMLLLLTTVFIAGFMPVNSNFVLLEMSKVFTSLSLTLFGGGYVMIPALLETVVTNNAWVSEKEFVDAIALGQVTPGPILISATFIGYKIKGLLGALVATVSIFLPSSVLMILVSQSLYQLENNKTWNAIVEGLKPVVVGLILYAVYLLATTMENIGLSAFLFMLSLILINKIKLNVFVVFLIGGIVGVLYLFI